MADQDQLQPLNPGWLGSHQAAFYLTPEEMVQQIARFFTPGLRRSVPCTAIFDRNHHSALHEALQKAGLPSEAIALLELLTPEETYLYGGTFSQFRMIGMILAKKEDAEHEGYSAVYLAGDLSWILDVPVARGVLATYEEDVNPYCMSKAIHGLCLYDRGRLLPAHLWQALSTHPGILLDHRVVENPYFQTRVSTDFRQSREAFEVTLAKIGSQAD